MGRELDGALMNQRNLRFEAIYPTLHAKQADFFLKAP